MAVVRPVVIVSNRGPVSFVLEGDDLVARRGAGGLTSALSPLLRDTGTLWIAAAMTDGDRVVAERGATEAEGFRIQLLDFDAATWSDHYDRVCNEALWFVHHGLFDPVHSPNWPTGWVDGPWEAHRRVNRAFAAAVIANAPEGAAVLVQDYHLCLVAETVREKRPDLRLVHFSHTPFAPPVLLRSLPEQVRRELLGGLCAFHAVGFHTDRWADDFRASCVDQGITAPACFTAALGPDGDDLAATVASTAFGDAATRLDQIVGDRAFIVRVDRLELSKNVLRGFEAFETLLDDVPEWRGRVIFGAFVYPSRQGVPAYDRYAREVAERVEGINSRFTTADWTPILYDPVDDYPRSMAALSRADVVLVNPIRDGLNLVAKEAMLVNQRDGQLVLSPEAGAWDELGVAAWKAEPFDVGATAEALAGALAVGGVEREGRASRLRTAASARTPAAWLADQIRAAS